MSKGAHVRIRVTGPVRKASLCRRFLKAWWRLIVEGVEVGSTGHVCPTRVPHVGAPVTSEMLDEDGR